MLKVEDACEMIHLTSLFSQAIHIEYYKVLHFFGLKLF
jgi:hypothetical protein